MLLSVCFRGPVLSLPAGPGLPGQGVPSEATMTCSGQAVTVRLLSFLSSSFFFLTYLLTPLLVFLRLLPVGLCFVVFEGRGFRLRWGKPRGRSAIPQEGTPRPECLCCVFTIVLHVP